MRKLAEKNCSLKEDWIVVKEECLSLFFWSVKRSLITLWRVKIFSVYLTPSNRVDVRGLMRNYPVVVVHLPAIEMDKDPPGHHFSYTGDAHQANVVTVYGLQFHSNFPDRAKIRELKINGRHDRSIRDSFVLWIPTVLWLLYPAELSMKRKKSVCRDTARFHAADSTPITSRTVIVIPHQDHHEVTSRRRSQSTR